VRVKEYFAVFETLPGRGRRFNWKAHPKTKPEAGGAVIFNGLLHWLETPVTMRLSVF